MTDALWGVKCTSSIGWYGHKHPARMTEEQARKLAAHLNATDDERWEARLLGETKSEPYKEELP